jgi:hypothetical protein
MLVRGLIALPSLRKFAGLTIRITPPWHYIWAAHRFLYRTCLRCGHPFSWWEARALATEHWECPVTSDS